MLIWFFFLPLKGVHSWSEIIFWGSTFCPSSAQKNLSSYLWPVIISFAPNSGMTLPYHLPWCNSWARYFLEKKNRAGKLFNWSTIIFSRFMSFALSFKWYNWKDNGKEETTEFKKNLWNETILQTSYGQIWCWFWNSELLINPKKSVFQKPLIIFFLMSLHVLQRFLAFHP